MKHKIVTFIVVGILSSSAANAHSLYAQARQITGSKNQPVLITDSHGVRLYNGADHAVELAYHYKLCVADANCKEVDVPVHLEPHSGVPDGQGKWTNQMPLQIQHKWGYAGTHQIISETWIEGEGAAHVIDYNTVTIY